MSALKTAAIVLIVAGILGQVYGGFSYTRETHEARLGPIELSVQEKDRQRPGMGRRGGDRDWRCDPALWN